MTHLIHPAIARAQAAEIALAADRRQHAAPLQRTAGRRTTPRRAAVALLRRQAVHTG
jgi:hypothetical protein